MAVYDLTHALRYLTLPIVADTWHHVLIVHERRKPLHLSHLCVYFDAVRRFAGPMPYPNLECVPAVVAVVVVVDAVVVARHAPASTPPPIHEQVRPCDALLARLRPGGRPELIRRAPSR